ncbi:type I restriction endonuclease subunit R, partial [Providencia manganoxydans]
MVSNTNEQALEASIERALTGHCLEDQKAGISDGLVMPYRVSHCGYSSGFPSDFNIKYAIDERFFWQFLQKTQEVELAKLQK